MQLTRKYLLAKDLGKKMEFVSVSVIVNVWSCSVVGILLFITRKVVLVVILGNGTGVVWRGGLIKLNNMFVWWHGTTTVCGVVVRRGGIFYLRTQKNKMHKGEENRGTFSVNSII